MCVRAFHNCLLICPLRIAASACSAIDELLAVEFQYSLRLIEPPLIRTRVWRHSNAVGPTSSKSSISVRSVASFRKSIALSQSQQSVSARALALAAFTRHSRQSLGIDSR